MTATNWDDHGDPLEDIANMVSIIRRDAGKYTPDKVVLSLHMYAFATLGYRVEYIRHSLKRTLSYTVPKISLWSHIKECFNWRRPRADFGTFERAVSRMLNDVLGVDLIRGA